METWRTVIVYSAVAVCAADLVAMIFSQQGDGHRYYANDRDRRYERVYELKGRRITYGRAQVVSQEIGELLKPATLYQRIAPWAVPIMIVAFFAGMSTLSVITRPAERIVAFIVLVISFTGTITIGGMERHAEQAVRDRYQVPGMRRFRHRVQHEPHQGRAWLVTVDFS